MKLDAHQHFWKYNPAEYGWINDAMAALRRDFLPEDLASERERIGFEGSIAVQARQTVGETEWLLDLAERYPGIKGVVGWLDLCRPSVEECLERFLNRRKLCGLRHVLQDEPDDGFMLRADFLRGVRQLAQHDLVYDILIFPRHLPNAFELAERLPRQRFVLDHIAKPRIRERRMEPWASEIRKLGTLPNVSCKVSGMVTEGDWGHWRAEDFSPYLDTAFDAFGVDRLMIGSDWPVCTIAGSYADVIGIVIAYLASFSEAERAAVLGENARRIYRIRE